MVDYDALLAKYLKQLEKALAHLEYSQKKVSQLSIEVAKLDEEGLETWEGLVARFSRLTDIFLNKYLRTCLLREEARFRGTLRDLLNFSEKQGLVSNAGRWLALRELRNRAAHEYLDEQLEDIFRSIRGEVPFACQDVRTQLQKYEA